MSPFEKLCHMISNLNIELKNADDMCEHWKKRALLAERRVAWMAEYSAGFHTKKGFWDPHPSHTLEMRLGVIDGELTDEQ